MNPRYAPKTPEGRLARLGEEIGEVMIEAGKLLQVLGKAGRFGPCSRYPNDGPTNVGLILEAIASLRIEMDDLSEAASLVEADFLDQAPCPNARD